jgi:hypothetical protein
MSHSRRRDSGRAWTQEALFLEAPQMEKRLRPCFSDELPKYMSRTVTNISKSLAQLKDGGAAHDIVGAIERLIGDLESIPNGEVRDTILRSAEVIFCTLASAGGLAFKSMVELYPRGLNMMDSHGMTPFDQLCCSARRTEPNVELL